jgi:hypothetical protein
MSKAGGSHRISELMNHQTAWLLMLFRGRPLPAYKELAAPFEPVRQFMMLRMQSATGNCESARVRRILSWSVTIGRNQRTCPLASIPTRTFIPWAASSR